MTQLIKTTLLSFILLFLSGYCFAQEYAVIKNKTSLEIYKKGKKLTKTSYEDVIALPDNYFGVKKSDKYGILNPEGVLVVPYTFDGILHFSKNLFLVKQNNKWGLVNHRNRVLLSPEYVGFHKQQNNLYKIKGNDGSGFINGDGVVLIPPIYEDIAAFSEQSSYYQVTKSGKKGLIDELGSEIIPLAYDSIYMLKGSNFCIGKKADRQEIINLVSRRINTLQGDFNNQDVAFDEIDMSYGSAFLILKKGSQIGFYINNTFTPIIYDRIVYYEPNQGVIAVKQGNKYGLVLKNGKVIPPVYDNLSRFNGGVAFAEKNGRLLNINLDGEEINL